MNRTQEIIALVGILALALFLSFGVSNGWTGHTTAGEYAEGTTYTSVLARRPPALVDHGRMVMIDSWDEHETNFDLWFGGIVGLTLIGIYATRGKRKE